MVNSKYKFVLIIATIVGVILVGINYYKVFVYEKTREDTTIYRVLHGKAFRNALLANDPSSLQKNFLYDIEKGKNDEFTKSDAYFITHRYFDNGGNIYEISDYIAQNKALSFLNEAKNIYPDVFNAIENRTLPKKFSYAGMHAMLAYMEVLDTHGYADIATLGTLANQYIKLAYFSSIKNTIVSSAYPETLIKNDLEKGIKYLDKTQTTGIKLLYGIGYEQDDYIDPFSNPELFFSETVQSKFRARFKNVTVQSLLVGLNQYAAGIRYLNAHGIGFDSMISDDVIFRFSMELSKKYVPELLLFTSLLNGSTLVIQDEYSKEDLDAALEPLFNLGQIDADKREGIVEGILKARDYKYGYFPNTEIENEDLDVYGRYNIVLLANKSDNFKRWLSLNGWNESDFHLYNKNY